MKLELVMLTTVISMITERKVEALFDCYEKGDLTGTKVTLGSSLDITSQLPNGPGACKVPANSTVIFYENINHVGGVTALHTVKEEVFRPKFVVIKSILEIGSQRGIYVFGQKNFQGGLFKYFPGEIEDVKGDNKFGSAVVIDESSDWTIAGKCHLSNCQRRCLVCLRRAKTGHGASFIKSIDSTLVRKILTVLPGACLGKNYTGISRIDGVGCARKCDPYGVEDKEKPCDNNGDCICHRRRKGKTCSTFKKNSLVKCYKCQPGAIPCKPGSFWVETVAGLCSAAQLKGQTNIWSAHGTLAIAAHGIKCADQVNQFNCYCDRDYCNGDINKFINDPNYPRTTVTKKRRG